MTDTPSPLTEYGIKSTGIERLDIAVAKVVGHPDTEMRSRLFHSRRPVPGVGRFVLGQAVYAVGEEPYIDKVEIDPKSSIQAVTLNTTTHDGGLDLDSEVLRRMSDLWEDVFFYNPNLTPSRVHGWQLDLSFQIADPKSNYRAQRIESLYPTDQGSEMRGWVASDPLVMTYPILELPKGIMAEPMFAMFGRFNEGDVVVANVDFEKYPYMKRRSFEDRAVMQAVIDAVM